MAWQKYSHRAATPLNGHCPGGPGAKTANVVLNMWWFPTTSAQACGYPLLLRVGNLENRGTGIAPGKDVDAVPTGGIEDNVPVEFQQHAHHWLILHGRYICVARSTQMRGRTSATCPKYEEQDPNSKTYQVVGSGIPWSMC